MEPGTGKQFFIGSNTYEPPQLKLSIAIIKLVALTASPSLYAGDFDNWYFEFLTGSTKHTEELDSGSTMARTITSLGGDLKPSTTYQRGTPTKEGEFVIVETSSPQSEIDTKNIPLTLTENGFGHSLIDGVHSLYWDSSTRWKKAPKGNFVGTFKDEILGEYTISLSLLPRNKFRISGSNKNDPRTFTTTGQLDADGKIHSTTKHRKGNYPLTYKNVVTKKPKPDLITERTWTNADGKELTAALVSVKDGTGRFRRPDGSFFKYELTKLSSADQKLIAEETFGLQ